MRALSFVLALAALAFAGASLASNNAPVVKPRPDLNGQTKGEFYTSCKLVGGKPHSSNGSQDVFCDGQYPSQTHCHVEGGKTTQCKGIQARYVPSGPSGPSVAPPPMSAR